MNDFGSPQVQIRKPVYKCNIQIYHKDEYALNNIFQTFTMQIKM